MKNTACYVCERTIEASYQRLSHFNKWVEFRGKHELLCIPYIEDLCPICHGNDGLQYEENQNVNQCIRDTVHDYTTQLKDKNWKLKKIFT